MRYVTVSEMREIDRRAIEERGIPVRTLMNNAGKALSNEASLIANKGDAVIFCGYGNNGGDGLAAARYLAEKGALVKVFMVGKPKQMSPETEANYNELIRLNIRPEKILGPEEIYPIFKDAKKPYFIIDAIFGIGFKGLLDHVCIKLIELINSSGVPVISADIPSGLNADTGRPLPLAVKASATVTFGYPKKGFQNPEAVTFLGKVVVADIGLG